MSQKQQLTDKLSRKISKRLFAAKLRGYWRSLSYHATRRAIHIGIVLKNKI